MVPWVREEGQAPVPPLVGAMLALLHGWLTQAAEEVEPSGLVLPVGQFLQRSMEVPAAPESENRPAGQSSQPVWSGFMYCPAVHVSI